MKTLHSLLFSDARLLNDLPDASVDLIVTSPPYPMIAMWDAAFSSQSPHVKDALGNEDGNGAFEAMHRVLDQVWAECFRVLRPGGIACVNIGDAVRRVRGAFQVFSNHSRAFMSMSRSGFTPLPSVLWHKPTNAPTKFMGSGTLPAGAYVTYEHEYILIFRKGSKRVFSSPAAKQNRRRSAFFWEERNLWFSDIWRDIRGASQDLLDPATRARNAAFPFELAYRLVSMHSVYGDTVLDPFAGTGTTNLAALSAGRNSVSVEFDRSLRATIRARVKGGLEVANERIHARLEAHREFAACRFPQGLATYYTNAAYRFPVVTSQEVDLKFYRPTRIHETAPDTFEASYEPAATDSCEDLPARSPTGIGSMASQSNRVVHSTSLPSSAAMTHHRDDLHRGGLIIDKRL